MAGRIWVLPRQRSMEIAETAFIRCQNIQPHPPQIPVMTIRKYGTIAAIRWTGIRNRRGQSMRIEDECSHSAAVVAECSNGAVHATPNEPAIHLNPSAYPKAGLAPVSYREHYFPGVAGESWDDW